MKIELFFQNSFESDHHLPAIEEFICNRPHDNCVSGKGPDGKNRAKASVHAQVKYENIVYDFEG
mgnify:CR=1 FL=1